jgi:hypothetical protein
VFLSNGQRRKEADVQQKTNYNGLSGMSGLASNPGKRQIASSSGASGAPQKKNLDFFIFFLQNNLKNMI